MQRLRARPYPFLLQLTWVTLWTAAAPVSWALEDPTRPANVVAGTAAVMAAPSNVRLQGVFTEGAIERALINDELLVVGQRTPQFTLLKIFSNSVEIKHSGGEVRRLWLTEQIKDM